MDGQSVTTANGNGLSFVAAYYCEDDSDLFIYSSMGKGVCCMPPQSYVQFYRKCATFMLHGTTV